MRYHAVISTVAFLEMTIGSVTITALIAFFVAGTQEKSMAVFWFVLLSAWVSLGIGLGLLLRRRWARTLIVFFSGYIILTKVLLFAGLLRFNGEIMTMVPMDVKNIISTAYHLFLVVYFTRPAVKREFGA